MRKNVNCGIIGVTRSKTDDEFGSLILGQWEPEGVCDRHGNERMNKFVYVGKCKIKDASIRKELYNRLLSMKWEFANPDEDMKYELKDYEVKGLTSKSILFLVKTDSEWSDTVVEVEADEERSDGYILVNPEFIKIHTDDVCTDDCIIEW